MKTQTIRFSLVGVSPDLVSVDIGDAICHDVSSLDCRTPLAFLHLLLGPYTEHINMVRTSISSNHIPNKQKTK